MHVYVRRINVSIKLRFADNESHVKKTSIYEFQNSTYEQNFVHKRGLVVKIASLM